MVEHTSLSLPLGVASFYRLGLGMNILEEKTQDLNGK
jgi:hypothetical protein